MWSRLEQQPVHTMVSANTAMKQQQKPAAGAAGAGLTQRRQALRDGRQDVHDHVRLQAGDEVHVVLSQHLQQRVEGLAQLGIVLQEAEPLQN